MTLEDLNALSPDAAAAGFQRCCGATRWAQQMAARRPFRSEADMVDAADQIWISLGPVDWLEAFAAHPRIGSGESRGAGKSGDLDEWAVEEQSGVASADSSVRQRLAPAHPEYEEEFG